MRWWMTRTRATCAALLMIWTTSRSLSSLGTGPGQSTQRLPGASACNCVAAFIAASSSMTGVSSSYSTCTRSAASCAAAWLSATTIATASPTCIAVSASTGRNGIAILAPPRPTTGGWREMPAMPAALMSAAVNIASTPLPLRASSAFTDSTRAWACGERTKAA